MMLAHEAAGLQPQPENTSCLTEKCTSRAIAIDCMARKLLLVVATACSAVISCRSSLVDCEETEPPS